MTCVGADPPAAPSIVIVGLGNRDRGDDGVGPAVADRLAGTLPPHVRVIRMNGDALALIDTWADTEAAIVVDAAVSGAKPGHVLRIDAVADELPTHLALSSTHSFGLVDAIALARVLDRLPPALVIYAIEAATFDAGTPITDAVSRAVPMVVERIKGDLRALWQIQTEGVTHA
ncbi:MAG: hydrogenase maturation protease [Acetobacteraceae bacterium]